MVAEGTESLKREIGEHKRALEAIEKTQGLSESIVDTVREPLLVLDGDLRILSANRSFYRSFQVTPEQTEGRLIYELGNGQWDIPALRRLLGDISRERPSIEDFEVEHDFESIGHRTMLLNARRLAQASGEEEMILLAIEDITERKRADKALRERVKELNGLYAFSEVVAKPGVRLDEIFQAAVAIIPAVWQYPEITCARVRLEGHVFTTANFTETPWKQTAAITVHGEPVGAVEAYYLEEKPAADEGPFLKEKRIFINALAERLGQITERMRAEEAVRTLTAELEQRVAQLEAANKELEAFAHSVAHDLRAPLRAIDGFSRVLLKDHGEQLDEEGKDCLKRVRAANQRMAQLIDDILDLSRVTRSEMCHEGVDLSGLASSIAGELRQGEPEREVEFDITPGLAAKGDPQLLRVVLENLLRNAWKFTAAHERARIEFGAETAEGKAVFFVRDDGAGFDMQYADKLFGAFQRLHQTTEFPGTGIGLATVRRIIHRHGGRVWAKGAVEHGATFYFTLQPAKHENGLGCEKGTL